MITKLVSAAFTAVALCLTAIPASAGAEPYLGEIDTFAFQFCPTGWMPLDGSLLPIASNTALFSLLGTYYGGDGVTNFALPLAKPIFTLNQSAPPLTQCIAVAGIFPSRN
jgi:microcystin-dependent protein